MNYRKVGGLHFVQVGRFGASFYVKRTVAAFDHFWPLVITGYVLFGYALAYVD